MQKYAHEKWHCGCRRWRWRKEMMALLAIGTAVLMTAVAVAISGLVLQAILFVISRSLTSAELQVEQMGAPNVISLKTSESAMSGMEWAKEAAA
jgi:hypothetical protein